MTREEAKRLLEKMMPQPQRGDGKSISHLMITEAFNIAIKALEQQPCEDCISRQEAISAIQDEYYADAIGIDIVDIIANLPSVTPKAESRNVLAEIKAEIEQKCCITVGSDNEPAITLYDVFQIIDKYRKGGVE
jgi:hypothetical protein